MLQRYTSSKRIIGSIISKFNVDVPFKNDVIEWMGDTIEKIGYHVGFVNKIETTRFTNFTIPLPCDFFTLNYILYGDKKLIYGVKKSKPVTSITYDTREFVQLLNARTKLIENEELDEVDVLILKNIEAMDYVSDLTTDNNHDIVYLDDQEYAISHALRYIDDRLQTNVVSYHNYSDEYYTNGLNCYKCSIEQGIVNVFYKAFPVDEEGFPLVVDEVKYREALEWNIILNLIHRGQRFSNFDLSYVERKASLSIARASNEHKKMTYEEMENFRLKWTNLIS